MQAPTERRRRPRSGSRAGAAAPGLGVRRPRGPRRPAGARSGALIRIWRRSRSRRRKRGAGPSATRPRRQPPRRAPRVSLRPRSRRRLGVGVPRARPGSGARTAGSRARGGARARRRGSPPRRGGPLARSPRPPGARVCTSTRPPPLAAAAAARELGDEREGALLRAQVGKAQGRVGVDDDAEHDVVEVVPLGDHLGPDQHPRGRAAWNACRISRWPPTPAELSASSRKTCSGRDRGGDLVLDPLAARPGPSPGSPSRSRDRRAAAARPWPQWWQRRPSPARWTTSETSQLGHSATQPQARQVRCGAQPRRLISTIAFSPRSRRPPSAARVLGCSGPSRPSRPRMSSTSTVGQRRSVDPARQLQPLELEPALRPRRRRAERPAPRPRGGAPVAGDLAGVVARIALLLVAARRAPRRRRPGRARRSARTPPSAGRRRSAPRRGAAGATRRAARPALSRECSTATRSPNRAWNRDDRLRRHPDLRHEHDHPAPALQRRLGGGEVDLGLARAGDPVQEQLAARRLAGVEAGDDPSTAPAGPGRARPSRGSAPIGDRARAPATSTLARARPGRGARAAAARRARSRLGEPPAPSSAPDAPSSSSARRCTGPERRPRPSAAARLGGRAAP